MIKPPSIAQIKTEVNELSRDELIQTVLRLAKFQKVNKELLGYLLFEASDEQAYRDELKTSISFEFENINTLSVFFVKKSVRKILKETNKFIRYSGNKETEVQVLLHFCDCLKNLNFQWKRSQIIINMYNSAIKKIEKALEKLHEDLQFDYQQDLEKYYI